MTDPIVIPYPSWNAAIDEAIRVVHEWYGFDGDAMFRDLAALRLPPSPNYWPGDYSSPELGLEVVA